MACKIKWRLLQWRKREGKEQTMNTIVVSKQGDGAFTSIQEAINSIPRDNTEEVVIRIKNGVYKEKIQIENSYITLEGEEKEHTVISYDDYAKKTFANGEAYRTFHTYTMFVGGSHVRLHNLTVENTAGLGSEVGQAVALYVEGDLVQVENVRLLGNQDTLFTGPLPWKPIEGNDFGGPMEGKPRIVGRQYYKDCYIEGDIDFIFGSAIALFEGCELFSKNLNREINGYVTAASTYENQEFGYVFKECRFTSNAKENSVYLGRPWRNHAKTVLISCELGAHIRKEGWDDWDKTEAQDTTYYAEYESRGEGAAPGERVSWSYQMSEKEKMKYNYDTIFKIKG